MNSYYSIKGFSCIFKVHSGAVYNSNEKHTAWESLSVSPDILLSHPQCENISKNNYKKYSIIIEELKNEFYKDVLSNKSE